MAGTKVTKQYQTKTTSGGHHLGDEMKNPQNLFLSFLVDIYDYIYKVGQAKKALMAFLRTIE